jgi:hypothetical protein
MLRVPEAHAADPLDFQRRRAAKTVTRTID